MIYSYICECGNIKEIDIILGYELPKNIECEKCNKIMKHDFFNQIKNQVIKVPENFKAVGKYNTRIKYEKDGTSDLM